ncbi:heme exporter protein CcmD [Shimia sp. R10_1]|uniref:heme exporter protein CcmD n=1 Tax=Shimia sp. R10_1 TaxID=2821095 RepID=UPI001ADAA44D|nr:heme exporter protein CcmD [Shimia sp. R10_1]MBO9471953.1 heme exporter protein CcmD [Shimia sp. R10_1]
MMPDLGKYADTVLSSYAVSLLLIAGLVWLSIRAARKARADLDKVEARRNERS